jgi:flagellar motor switch protein FliG
VSTGTAMTRTQKAAVVLLAMGEDASAEVFKHFSEHEIEVLVREISTLGAVPPGDTAHVMEEFHAAAVAADISIRGDDDFSRRVITRTHGADAARKIAERVHKSAPARSAFSVLERADPRQVSKFILGEHPQTIALILAHMQPPVAAQFIALLPDALRVDVLTRIASLEEISPEIVARISAVLERRLESLSDASREQRGGVRTVAALFNHLERNVGNPVLEAIESATPDLAVSIRNLMFVFDDLARVDDNGLRELIQRADKKTLTIALKGASEELRQKLFGNMSKRAADMMREEMDVMGAVRMREVEKAQQAIVAVAKSLEEEGLIVTGEGAEDEYVR